MYFTIGGGGISLKKKPTVWYAQDFVKSVTHVSVNYRLQIIQLLVSWCVCVLSLIHIQMCIRDRFSKCCHYRWFAFSRVVRLLDYALSNVHFFESRNANYTGDPSGWPVLYTSVLSVRLKHTHGRVSVFPCRLHCLRPAYKICEGKRITQNR